VSRLYVSNKIMCIRYIYKLPYNTVWCGFCWKIIWGNYLKLEFMKYTLSRFILLKINSHKEKWVQMCWWANKFLKLKPTAHRYILTKMQIFSCQWIFFLKMREREGERRRQRQRERQREWGMLESCESSFDYGSSW
jgi:hypothetical protein